MSAAPLFFCKKKKSTSVGALIRLEYYCYHTWLSPRPARKNPRDSGSSSLLNGLGNPDSGIFFCFFLPVGLGSWGGVFVCVWARVREFWHFLF